VPIAPPPPARAEPGDVTFLGKEFLPELTRANVVRVALPLGSRSKAPPVRPQMREQFSGSRVWRRLSARRAGHGTDPEAPTTRVLRRPQAPRGVTTTKDRED